MFAKSFHSDITSIPKIPKSERVRPIAVLLATYNGAPWLGEQINSILAQIDVSLTVYASDDVSSDATPQILAKYAEDSQVRILPSNSKHFGNAHRNFLRLIAEAPLDEEEFVAFSDQDDIWLPDKLSRAIAALTSQSADAYSSDVIAFWPDGREQLVIKSQAQRQFDYLFESAGPGCTFVLPRDRFEELRQWVIAHWEEAQKLRVHDWLIYAYARQNSWRWFIDPAPTVRYRQHGGNERGANIGLRAARIRWSEVRSGQYFQEVRAYRRALGRCTRYDLMLDRFNLIDRLRLAISVQHFRRRQRDQLILAMMFLITK